MTSVTATTDAVLETRLDGTLWLASGGILKREYVVFRYQPHLDAGAVAHGVCYPGYDDDPEEFYTSHCRSMRALPKDHAALKALKEGTLRLADDPHGMWRVFHNEGAK